MNEIAIKRQETEINGFLERLPTKNIFFEKKLS